MTQPEFDSLQTMLAEDDAGEHELTKAVATGIAAGNTLRSILASAMAGYTAGGLDRARDSVLMLL